MLNEIATFLVGSNAVFNVHYWGVVPDLPDNSVHKHSFFEVCFILGGEGEYTDAGIHYPLRAGTHICSRPGVRHQIRTTDGLFILYVAFELDETRSDDKMLEAYRNLANDAESCVQVADDHPTSLLWKLLLLQKEESMHLPESSIPPLAYTLLLSFLTLFGKKRYHSIGMTRAKSNVLLQRAKLYVRDNLSQPLSILHVAEYLNVSARHLSRLFSTGIHESFTNYLISERIRQAANLLITTEHSIKEIAEATGFSSVHYFTRLFKQIKNIPPGEFRRKG
jgi:AraC family L-rhamnose operon transcriptional activator RhaR